MTAEPWRATPDGVVVTCRLTPKGGRERLVVVSEPARAAVSLYLALLKQRLPGAASVRIVR